MKIYLATGFTVLCKKGREQELSKRFAFWNRLQSYYFKDIWLKLLKEVYDDNSKKSVE